jgi:hypothetical protein
VQKITIVREEASALCVKRTWPGCEKERCENRKIITGDRYILFSKEGRVLALNHEWKSEREE